MAAPIPTPPTTLARTGPAPATVPLNSATSIAPAAATPPGTPLTLRAAAARKTWSALAAPVCSTASPPIRRFMKLAPGLLLAVSSLPAQAPADTPDAHFAAAKTAAGDDFPNLLQFQCYGPGPGGNRGGAAGAARGGRGGGGQGGGQRAGGRAPGPPDRSTWHLEPVKVFDNLYF